MLANRVAARPVAARAPAQRITLRNSFVGTSLRAAQAPAFEAAVASKVLSARVMSHGVRVAASMSKSGACEEGAPPMKYLRNLRLHASNGVVCMGIDAGACPEGPKIVV